MARRTKKKTVASIKDYHILREPVITEKSSIVGGDGSQVVFKVDRRADKTVIKKAVEKIYNVEIAKIRTCNYQGKLKRTLRQVGRTAAYKKAYVTLKEGNSIDIVEGL